MHQNHLILNILYIRNKIKILFSLKQLNRIFFVLLTITFFFSCGTKKKSRTDVSKLGKLYHNTTSKFNGYFNAEVLKDESIATLNEQHEDNYNQVLTVYPYVDAPNPEAVSSNLDDAIKKVSVVVNLHRVSHWTDDCYLLLGQSQYVKREYESAEESLMYMLSQFDEEGKEKEDRSTKSKKGKKSKKKGSSTKKTSSSSKSKSSGSKSSSAKKKKKKRKKKSFAQGQSKKKKKKKKKKKSTLKKVSKKPTTTVDAKTETSKTTDKLTKSETKKPESKIKDPSEKPESYVFKHRPAYQDAKLWVARTLIERQNYDEAERFIRDLEESGKTHKDIRADLAVVKSHLNLRQKKYEDAIPHLEQAIENAKKKKEKARYAYIIAQIHEKAGRGEKAYAGYEQVLKYNPTYDMEFASRLNLATNSWESGKATASAAIKTLNKMLKDIKNEEFKDQIYFALADIALKTNDKPGAIENLVLSLANNNGNKSQRAESYLQLASLYYEDEVFVSAKNYYDSTLMVLPNTDERYDEVARYAANLTDIAKNINIINLQDSLLTIAMMTPKQQQDLALAIKEKRDAAARAAKDAGMKNAKPDPGSRNSRSMSPATLNRNPTVGRGGPNSGEPSTWWAYNDRSVKKGKRDFDREWNNRPLEDNWRRANKRGLSDITEIEAVEVEVDLEDIDQELLNILKDVPRTKDQRDKANMAIQNAMFELGTLYRDRLERSDKAVKTHEGLIDRYPETTLKLDTWYNLYLAHTDLNNKVEAKRYFDLITKEFGESTYARVLQDPDFLKATQEEANKLNRYYKETYVDFETGKYQKSFDKINKSDEMFGPTNKLKPKFHLLSALCVGNLKGKDAYINALKEVVAKYPDTDEEKRAKEILRLLGSKVSGGIAGSGSNNSDSEFKIEDNKVHYIIAVLDGKKTSLEEAKTKISDYNREYHKLEKLRISNVFLGADTSTPIVVIRRFKTKDIAMEYYNEVMRQKKKFLGKNDDAFELFAVNQSNYRSILKAKSITDYRKWFLDTYF